MPTIRPGKKEDLPQVLELIRELATYEKAPEEVVNTVERMERDASSYILFVAEHDNRIVGISISYWRYSTWKGRRLYLEDIVVREGERGKGFGKLLFERTMEYAVEQDSQGMMWQVLDWNEPAINFYKTYGAKFDSTWVNCTLERDQLLKLVKK